MYHQEKVFLVFQCTEEDHRDKEDIFKAVTIMSNIAAFINESKRRKDIGKLITLEVL